MRLHYSDSPLLHPLLDIIPVSLVCSGLSPPGTSPTLPWLLAHLARKPSSRMWLLPRGQEMIVFPAVRHRQTLLSAPIASPRKPWSITATGVICKQSIAYMRLAKLELMHAETCHHTDAIRTMLSLPASLRLGRSIHVTFREFRRAQRRPQSLQMIKWRESYVLPVSPACNCRLYVQCQADGARMRLPCSRSVSHAHLTSSSIQRRHHLISCIVVPSISRNPHGYQPRAGHGTCSGPVARCLLHMISRDYIHVRRSSELGSDNWLTFGWANLAGRLSRPLSFRPRPESSSVSSSTQEGPCKLLITD